MRALLAALVLMLLAGSAWAEWPSPLKAGGVITGKLRVVHTRHPNGTPITAYQLVTDKPYTVENDEFCDQDHALTVVHLVAMTKPLQKLLQRSLNKVRSVTVGDAMCSETAWHVGDIVVFQWELLP